MYTLFRTIPVSRLIQAQLPALLAALVIAEAFYKFHSFTLECLAFLATWAALDAALSGAIAWRERRPAQRR